MDTPKDYTQFRFSYRAGPDDHEVATAFDGWIYKGKVKDEEKAKIKEPWPAAWTPFVTTVAFYDPSSKTISATVHPGKNNAGPGVYCTLFLTDEQPTHYKYGSYEIKIDGSLYPLYSAQLKALRQFVADIKSIPDTGITLIGTNGLIHANRDILFARCPDIGRSVTDGPSIKLPYSKAAIEIFYGYIKSLSLDQFDSSIQTLLEVLEMAREYKIDVLRRTIEIALCRHATQFSKAWAIVDLCKDHNAFHYVNAIICLSKHAGAVPCNTPGCDHTTFDASQYRDLAAVVLRNCFAKQGIKY